MQFKNFDCKRGFFTSYKCGRRVSLCDALGPGCRHTLNSTEQDPDFGHSSHTAGWCGATACSFLFHTGYILCSSTNRRQFVTTMTLKLMQMQY